MFVFDNLLAVDDRGIQSLVREVTTDILVIALKGADQLGLRACSPCQQQCGQDLVETKVCGVLDHGDCSTNLLRGRC